MSSSDQETSSSYAQSPLTSDSPVSPPSQQVPQLAQFLNGLSCVDSQRSQDGRPFLRITEQPQDHFRFRYLSEMNGTHGCIFGRSHITNKTKTHPTVKLLNYTGPATIKCRLAQCNNDDDHPHKLLDNEDGRIVSVDLPYNGQYVAPFPDLGVIHSSKNEITNWLYEKHGGKFTLRVCTEMGKAINKNKVRLRFSAHDTSTDEEICPPVFSDPIHNLKSAATNDLKICRLSHSSGTPDGGDDVIMLCEKVNKKDIKIRFFEMQDGERVWEDLGNFLTTDVHHQYAIPFRTPKYKDRDTPKNVTVYVELFRPSDERVSEATVFNYIAKKVPRFAGKKRRAQNSMSSLNSSSGGSINSISNLPVVVANHSSLTEEIPKIQTSINVLQNNVNVFESTINQPFIEITHNANINPLADALQSKVGSERVLQDFDFLNKSDPMFAKPYDIPTPADPTFGHSLPDIQIDSEELNRMVTEDPHMSDEDKLLFADMDLKEYFQNSTIPNCIQFNSKEWVADSGRAKREEPKPSTSSKSPTAGQDKDTLKQKDKDAIEYNAFYKAEDAAEVKKLVKELVTMIRNKTGHKKQHVQMKLERLFQLRLSNGDSFLHMTLCSKQPSMEYIVKIINSQKMTHLLNLQNHCEQTVLHLAIVQDMPKHVSFLVANGSDPMIPDNEENNAIHYAATWDNCFEVLLKAIKDKKLNVDFKALNNQKQSALHISITQGNTTNVKLLLEYGADYAMCDREGRSSVHLAAYDGQIDVVRVMLKFIKEGDINATDGRGNTVLQILCGRDVKEGLIEVIKELLEKKADPKKHELNSYPAWKLAKDKPEILELIKKYTELPEEDDNSELEDDADYESAEEGEPQTGLAELDSYLDEISPLLDASSAWMHLATSLDIEAPLMDLETTGSPSAKLLLRIKESCENLTSSALAHMLEKHGEKEAANIIRKHINNKDD